MQLDEKPDVTYNDIGGCKEQLAKLRDILELPILAPEKFI
jgi:26S proteasome regulatory subunit T1